MPDINHLGVPSQPAAPASRRDPRAITAPVSATLSPRPGPIWQWPHSLSLPGGKEEQNRKRRETRPPASSSRSLGAPAALPAPRAPPPVAEQCPPPKIPHTHARRMNYNGSARSRLEACPPCWFCEAPVRFLFRCWKHTLDRLCMVGYWLDMHTKMNRRENG